MDKFKVKKVLRKCLEIKTLCFIVLVSLSLCYFAKCFCKNQILYFGKNSSVILLGLFIMTIWVNIFCIYMIFENRKLLKTIISKDKIISQQNEAIKGLLNQVIDKTNTIEDNTEDILEQNEDNFDNLIKSNRNNREILLNNRGEKIA